MRNNRFPKATPLTEGWIGIEHPDAEASDEEIAMRGLYLPYVRRSDGKPTVLLLRDRIQVISEKMKMILAREDFTEEVLGFNPANWDEAHIIIPRKTSYLMVPEGYCLSPNNLGDYDPSLYGLWLLSTVAAARSDLR